MAQANAQREGPPLEYELRNDRSFLRAFAPRLKASTRQISLSAQNLIVACEVSSENIYLSRYQRPMWPGADSGATIGIGYDLGYIRSDWLHEDWDGLLDAATVQSLLPACRLRGASAEKFCRQNGHIQVPWAAAQEQFHRKLLPRFIEETLLALPNAEKLSDDSLGALVSLVYNRGSTFRQGGGRYLEMREVYAALKQTNFRAVPDYILSMRRLWPNARGLVLRRAAEAALFQRGLKNAS